MELFIMVPILLLFFLPTFLMYRKQRQHQQELQRLQSELSVGDWVVTGSGLHAQVVGLAENVVTLEIAEGTVARFERAAILRRDDAPVSAEVAAGGDENTVS